MKPSGLPSGTSHSHQSIIAKIGVLFAILILVIIGNGIYSLYRENQDAYRYIQTDIDRTANRIKTLLGNEQEKLDVIASIIKDNQLTIVDYMDYDMIRPIKVMLQTISSKHNVEMLFLFDEDRKLLTTNSFNEYTSAAGLPEQLLQTSDEKAVLASIPSEFIAPHFQGITQAFYDQNILCAASTVFLTHDLGNVYGYVVLLKPIAGNEVLLNRLQKFFQPELVIFNTNGQPVLSTFDTGPETLPFPDSKDYTVDGQPYLVDTRDIPGVDGKTVATLMVAFDKNTFFQQRNRLLLNIVPPFLATILIAVAFFLLLKTRVIDKINDLRNLLRSVATGQGDLSSRLEGISDKNDPSSLDEVQLMCRDFNQMMDMLESTFKKTEQQSELLTRQKDEMTSLYEEHRLILDSAGEGIYGINNQGETTFVNKATLSMTGFKEEEFVGQNPHQLIHHSRADGTLLPFEKCPVHGPITKNLVIRIHEDLFWRKDGSNFPVEFVCSPIVQNGVTHGAVVVFTDITERIEANKRIDEEKAFSDAVVNSIPGGFFVFDEKLRMIKWNRKLETITGYSSKELGALSIFDFFSPDHRDHLENALQRLSDQGAITIETVARKKDGPEIPFFLSACLVNIDHKNLIIAIGLDISEQKSIEAELRQVQKMEAIGTLAGGIAHDFNNILSPILGYAEIGEMTLPEDHEFYPHLTAIHDAANRAKNLVQQILTFSRVREHKIAPMIAQPIIKESLKFLRSSLPTTITIHEQINPDCGSILADPTQIHQVMMNLCTNAFHAMEAKGGTLLISLESIDLSEPDRKKYNNLPAGPYLCLTVADTGEGIDPEVVDRMFEPFFTTKTEGRGTGMGLAVVHGIIKSYGGTILVESLPGHGATFTILIPHTEMDIQETDHDSFDTIQGGTEHIMLVDDQEFVAGIENKLLSALGYKVSVFLSSREALEAFSKDPNSYDLVLTDQTMPDITGNVLAERLLEIRPDIPIVLCSGNDTFSPAINLKEIGIRHFIMKPLEIARVAHLLRTILDDRTVH